MGSAVDLVAGGRFSSLAAVSGLAGEFDLFDPGFDLPWLTNMRAQPA